MPCRKMGKDLGPRRSCQGPSSSLRHHGNHSLGLTALTLSPYPSRSLWNRILNTHSRIFVLSSSAPSSSCRL